MLRESGAAKRARMAGNAAMMGMKPFKYVGLIGERCTIRQPLQSAFADDPDG